MAIITEEIFAAIEAALRERMSDIPRIRDGQPLLGLQTLFTWCNTSALTHIDPDQVASSIHRQVKRRPNVQAWGMLTQTGSFEVRLPIFCEDTTLTYPPFKVLDVWKLKGILRSWGANIEIAAAITKPCPKNPSGYHTEGIGSFLSKHHRCINCGLEWIDGLGVIQNESQGDEHA